VIFFASCEENPLGTIDGRVTVSFASSPTVTPPALDLRSITPVNGLYPVPLVVRVTIESPMAAGLEVEAELLGPRSLGTVATASLHDNGVAPDSVAGDSRYAGGLTFQASRSDVGMFRVRLRARSPDGSESNSLESRFQLTRNNAVPVLSQLLAPDTVSLPGGGSLLIPMTVAAQDSDGLSDVREVYFRSLDSSDPEQRYFLRDDGDSEGQSGDQVEGDGIFSIVVELSDGPNVRRTFRFLFQAVDAPGDTSAALLHHLTVR
jgi:hypothetical protein